MLLALKMFGSSNFSLLPLAALPLLFNALLLLLASSCSNLCAVAIVVNEVDHTYFSEAVCRLDRGRSCPVQRGPILRTEYKDFIPGEFLNAKNVPEPLAPLILQQEVENEAEKGASGEAFSRKTREKNLFLLQFPQYNRKVEEIRDSQLKRLRGQVFLDYAGSGAYQEAQITSCYVDLMSNAYGNTHSRNPSARYTQSEISKARKEVLNFFNVGAAWYSVIFTSGATAALKIVGENFKWSSGSLFYYLRINHNSVLGIRGYANLRGFQFKSISALEVEEILQERRKKKRDGLKAHTHIEDVGSEPPSSKGLKEERPLCLFAFPAKDNFAGVYYPLSWIEDIREYGLSDNCDWKLLLDAAAYVSINMLDLSQYYPDFVAISFYKIFGYPTGLGALLLRTKSSDCLSKTYFGGGTIVAASCDSSWCVYKDDPSLRFEDGSISFIAISELKYGFHAFKSLDFNIITSNIEALTRYLVNKLVSLRHANGRAVIEIYGETDSKPLIGGVVNFNVLNPHGEYVGLKEFENTAASRNIHIRTGCFCNPGACQEYLGLTQTRSSNMENPKYHALTAMEHKEEEEEFLCTADFHAKENSKSVHQATGSIRVSLGYLSAFEDVHELLQFMVNTYVR